MNKANPPFKISKILELELKLWFLAPNAGIERIPGESEETWGV